MTPEERIFAGVLFAPGSPELVAKKLKTHNLDVAYNMTMEDEYEKRDRILHEILGGMGEGGTGPVRPAAGARRPHGPMDIVYHKKEASTRRRPHLSHLSLPRV